MTTPEPRGQDTPPTSQLPTHAGQLGAACCDRATAPNTDPTWLRAARTARTLSWFSLAWMTVEGTSA